jgi:hypothetical protein
VGAFLTKTRAVKHRQRASENLDAKVLFVAQAVGASLDDSDFVVEPLDEAKRDFVLWLAIGGDAGPMAIDHVGELFVGLQPLPLERRPPVVEEAPRPGFVRLLARSKVRNAWRPSKVRFSLRDSSLYFWPLMKRLSFPDKRAYSLFAPCRGLRPSG